MAKPGRACTTLRGPALVPGLLRGARNALVIPTGRAIIVDIDPADAWGELAAAGLPETVWVHVPYLRFSGCGCSNPPEG